MKNRLLSSTTKNTITKLTNGQLLSAAYYNELISNLCARAGPSVAPRCYLLS